MFLIPFKDFKMYYKLNNFAFVRNINNYLFILDTRNNSELLGDYGSFLFVKHLSYEPQQLENIVKEIQCEFADDVDLAIIKNDATTLFDRLIEFGLVSKSIDLSFPKLKLNDFSNDNSKTLIPKDEIEKFNKIKNVTPSMQNIIVEITKKCNERCVHCYIPHENKNIMMDDKDFYSIVDQCSYLGTVINFRISGGECMTHPSFKNFIKYVKEKGFALTILTNLTLLDDEIIEILKTGTLSRVQVSLFSLVPEIQDKITKLQGSLALTLKNLEKLYNAGIPVAIATQAMEMNKDSIEDLYEYSKNHGFDLRCDWTIVGKEDRNSSNLACRICNLEDYKKICRLKLKYIDGYKEELKDELSRKPKSSNSHLCNAGTNGVQIDTMLNVHPCPGWDLIVGSLKESSLAEIWNESEKLKKVRDIVLDNFPKCSKCDIRNLCSICMAQADIEKTAKNYEFEMPEYVCKMYNVIYDTIKKDVLEKE